MSKSNQGGVPEGYKRCSKCGEVKEVGEFGIDTRNPTGFQSHCRVCEKERIRLWRKNNPEKKRKENKSYQLKNTEKIKEISRTGYIKNRSERLSYGFFYQIGFIRSEIPPELFDAKVLQIKLKRAIKAQKNNEGHKGVTNG